ncbi:universal stress protein [Desulfobacula phenolica]|uniref:Nucleotide-binding universal stress protein, UspA family n=1 Tax=Desulfobacula phenolica TaxID=90732 RepID=A0A1H2EL70_9BACT|nr:universal stress protein [Desulfobacula phenolica]SDT95713.1 Nucleotide-binding universal stress protein, UspA family [Desulfobacula phenolica]
MEIRKLLFVTKFEDLCYDALKSLLALRRAALEHVVFLTVIERDKVAMKRGVGYLKEEEVKLKETANIRFIDWAENLFEMGMEVGAYMEVSSLIPEILRVVKKESPDLIVIGRSHKGPLEQLYAGSDVTELIRRTKVPILVFKHMMEDNIVPEKLFERPLFATNWSETGKKTVEYIKGMKNVIGELHIMHAVKDSALKSQDTHEVQQVRKVERKKLDELCDELEQEGINARGHVYVGDPQKEIEKAAKEYQASMIILGSSEKAAILERWVGSISKNIADKSIFPCFLIPGEKDF